MKSSLENFVSELEQQGVARSPYVRDAFLHIDRKDFVLPEYRSEAYEDYPLPIGQRQTISQPYTVAFMLDILDPLPGQSILDIGSGSGWTTALLAYIVSPQTNHKSQISNSHTSGKVYGIEIIPELCELGKHNCEKYGFMANGVVEFYCQDGNNGLPTCAPFDRILASAAVQRTDISDAWKQQLKIGGRIVAPIMDSVWVFDKIDEDSWKRTEYPGFTFVPFVGGA